MNNMLQKLLDEFKELNAEFLFKMLEQMNITGVLDDARVMQAMRNIRIEDFITMNMLETFFHPESKKQGKSDEKLLKTILFHLFAAFYGNRPLLFYNHPQNSRSTGAPHMVVMMSQLLDIEPLDKILILGSKSGYMESIIQDMDEGIKVFIVEKVEEIYNISKYNLNRINGANAEEKTQIFNLDPILSLDSLPVLIFDKILLTGYMKQVPQLLLDKLKIGGLLAGPFGEDRQQSLMRYFKTGEETFDEEMMAKVLFSPLETDF